MDQNPTPRDWKYQIAHIGDEWWVNMVGTYGMASAQLYILGSDGGTVLEDHIRSLPGD